MDLNSVIAGVGSMSSGQIAGSLAILAIVSIGGWWSKPAAPGQSAPAQAAPDPAPAAAGRSGLPWFVWIVLGVVAGLFLQNGGFGGFGWIR